MRLIPRSRGGALIRFALGALIVVLFTATSTAVALLLEFKQLAKDLSITPALKHAQIEIAHPGNPQTLLLIGSDHRFGTPWKVAHTDTMMLVRIDPNSSTINVLSIPRDLRVEIPQRQGFFHDKINDAYSIGGPNLLLRILRQQVFHGLRVNHIIDVNFGGFEDLINAIGCVYTDVDHRYYNNTLYTNYSSIDLQPGYQRLCGSDALAFVRFRHTDSDIVRNARQQDFLRWAKAQYGASQLIANRGRLMRIFGQHTQTDHDLHTLDGVLNLFNLVVFSAGHTIKQIPFPAILLPCGPAGNGAPCYVTATQPAEQHAFAAFMAPTRAAPAPHTAAGGRGRPGRPGRHAGRSGGGPADLFADPADGRAQVTTLPHGMPLYFPRLIAVGSHYCSIAACIEGPVRNSYPRAYLIHDQRNKAHFAYRLTLVLNPLFGQYFGVQGTTWQHPPILDSPTETRTVAGKKLLLFANGGKISLVGWKTPQGVYWISNTLTDDLSNSQMVAIAASLTR